jgi:hypothetical protein
VFAFEQEEAVTDLPVPEALEETFKRWDGSGRPAQSGTAWPLASWETTFPDQKAYLASLPNPLDRQAVTEACASAAASPNEAVQGFIAAMIWGYGRVGYGPFRTARVLTGNQRSPALLQEAARRVQRSGGPASFEWLADHRLHGLGVSFATKYLFFVYPDAPEPALILDRLVRSWLGRNIGWSPRLDWRTADYRKYISTVVNWATQLGISPDTVEYLMFTREVESDPASQWRQTFTAVPVATAATLTLEEAAVLDALNEAAEGFADLPEGASGDSEDFERGVRELRRIVLSRGRLSL